jgi:pimeloyl-ACP methyl ester carboxylesterase
MPYFKSDDGLNIYYKYLNQNSKKMPLLFIHGYLVNWTCFEKEINFFKKEKHPIIYLDLRGHGLSDIQKDESHLKINQMIEDISILIKKLNLKNIIIVGHSMGGIIGLYYSKRFPKIVNKLVMIDSSYKSPDKIKFLHNIAEKHLLKKIFKMYFKHKDINVNIKKQKKIEYDVTKEEKKTNPYIFFIKSILRNNPETVFVLGDELLNTKIKHLEKVQCPVLILGHMNDQLFSKEEQLETARKLKNHIIKFFEGTHDSIIRHPNVISHEIKQFIYTNNEYFKK